jgi:hypothetical protein
MRAAAKPNAPSRTDVRTIVVATGLWRVPAAAESARSTLCVNLRLLGVGLLLTELRRIGRDNGALHFTSVWHRNDLGLILSNRVNL